ncbi:nuclear transport factor 2 family protein [Oryzifoliimicrobium ureilyticus]|uniref:nuclear transport factor 2 family protein n=1 Tax=Oryzifoliimicrobium ureilyticus TaxID=3113724 RepID=UPI0030766709
MSNTAIAASFFDALAREDEQALRAICARDFKPQQNGAPPLTLDALLGFAKAVHAVLKDFQYADPVCSATKTGFVQEHSVRGTLPNGAAVDLAVCVVGDISGERLVAAREYFDSASASELLAELGNRPG